MSGIPPVMTADTVNCASAAPGTAAAVMTTVPATPPAAGSGSATLVSSGMAETAELVTGGPPRGGPATWLR